MPEVAAQHRLRLPRGDSVTLSPVLAAMGVPLDVGAGAIRLSLGRMTTDDELATLVERLTEVLASR